MIMLNQYETVFICTPVLSEPQVKEAVKKFRDIITENGGEMINEEDWGMKKLAPLAWHIISVIVLLANGTMLRL